jgi:hypothetical protein
MRLVWGRPVHLQIRIKDEMWLVSADEPGKEFRKERIGDSTPKPAHWIA